MFSITILRTELFPLPKVTSFCKWVRKDFYQADNIMQVTARLCFRNHNTNPSKTVNHLWYTLDCLLSQHFHTSVWLLRLNCGPKSPLPFNRESLLIDTVLMLCGEYIGSCQVKTFWSLVFVSGIPRAWFRGRARRYTNSRVNWSLTKPCASVIFYVRGLS